MIFAPVAWLLGVPWNDCRDHRQPAGHAPGAERIRGVSGTRADEAYPRSALFTIATYALCGFANFSSIAIQIGGIGALAPSRKSDLARLGLRAVAAGTMANFMSACIAGMLLMMHEARWHTFEPLPCGEPHIVVVLGSGLGAFADELADRD